MGHEIFFAVSLAGADYKNCCQSSGTGCQVDNQSTGKVKHTPGAQPATRTPDPVANRVVYKNSPEQTENQKRAEAHPFCKGTGDQCRRDNGKHTLVDHKDILWDCRCIVCTWLRCNTAKSKPRKITNKTSDIRTKRHAVSYINPLQADHRYHDKALQNCTKHIFSADHTSVKKGKPWGHK